MAIFQKRNILILTFDKLKSNATCYILGEKFTQAQTLRYLTILSPVQKWRKEGHIPNEDQMHPDQDDEFSYIPQVFKILKKSAT
jgi:hypothetical protein